MNNKYGGLLMRLKDLREDNDLKQATVADFLHIKQNTYSQYENGQRQLPIPLLIKLAKYYNVSTDYILGLTDRKDLK
ncbi:MAG: helix-turn-helix transcriptional regulator [Clostridia bacterium]|nr:helix-turn-helix transcriptional regulator [Clostridia bacterium]